MDNRKLEIYTFISHPRRKPEEKVFLEDVYGNDLYKKLKENFADFVDTFPPDKIEKRTVKIEKIKVDGKTKSLFQTDDNLRYVYGKIKIGDDDGKEQDVVENNKDKNVLYTKKKGESVERPYFFMVIIPIKMKYGFIILEREGKHSAKHIFEILIKKFVNEKLSGLALKMSNFVEADLIKEFLTDGVYNSIVLSRKIVSNDKCQQYLGTFIDGSKYKVELKITPLEDTVFPIGTKRKILNSIENNEGFFEAEEFKNIGFDEDANVKVISTYNGNTRTIDLEDTFKIRPYYNIECNNDIKGFSDLNSIKSMSIELVKSFNLNIL